MPEDVDANPMREGQGSMKGRVLVLGSGGQLGVELLRQFTVRGYEVIGRSRSELDVTDTAKVAAIIDILRPSVVVNSSAYNGVDTAEDEPLKALEVNALAVRNLAVAARRANAALVHFSTDYVFDGTKGESYGEDDLPSPANAYGVSKLAGEYYAQAYHDRAIVIRTSAVFGPAGQFTARGNFVELMLRLAAGDKPIRVVSDSFASPAYAPVLAARTVDLVERDAAGVFHGGGGVPVSWFDYAATIFRLAGVSPDLQPMLNSERRAIAKRPQYSALANTRMEELELEAFPSLESSVESYLQLRQVAVPAL